MAAVKDTLELDTMTCRQSAVIFRTNENVVKLLLWQDLIPVREDLYRMTELLEIGSRIHQLPVLIRRLMRGLQERLLQVSEAETYVDMVEKLFQYKPMYHTCLNTYFAGADECVIWKYYIQSCLQWRNNVVTEGCLKRKYLPVDFMSNCPMCHDETFSIDRQSDIRLKAVAEYLTFFGAEGKKYLGRASKYLDSMDILSKIKVKRDLAKREMAERENLSKSEKPLTSMTKKELHNQRNGVETRFNVHVTLIPFQEELITESEFIERLERQKKGLHNYYCYSADEDPTDVVQKGIKEYFAREFRHLVELNGEPMFPFDPRNGRVLHSVDPIEDKIRRNEIRQKPKFSLQTMEALSSAKKGHKRYANSPVDSLFPRNHTTTLAMRLTQDELINMFDKSGEKKPKTEVVEKTKSKPIELRITNGEPGIDIEIRRGDPNPKTNAIVKKRIWNKNPGGFCIDNIGKSKKLVMVSDPDSAVALATEAISLAESTGTPMAIKLTKEPGVHSSENQITVEICRDPFNLGIPDSKPKSKSKHKSTAPKKAVRKDGEDDVKKPPKKKDTAATESLIKEMDGAGKEATVAEDPSEALADWMVKRCYVCGNKDETKQCSRCHGVDYCSRECQVKDWPDHKYICELIKNDVEEKSTAE